MISILVFWFLFSKPDRKRNAEKLVKAINDAEEVRADITCTCLKCKARLDSGKTQRKIKTEIDIARDRLATEAAKLYWDMPDPLCELAQETERRISSYSPSTGPSGPSASLASPSKPHRPQKPRVKKQVSRKARRPRGS